MEATHITMPCFSSAVFIDNSGCVMTVKFLFFGASNNQQVGLLQVEAAAAV